MNFQHFCHCSPLLSIFDTFHANFRFFPNFFYFNRAGFPLNGRIAKVHCFKTSLYRSLFTDSRHFTDSRQPMYSFDPSNINAHRQINHTIFKIFGWLNVIALTRFRFTEAVKYVSITMVGEKKTIQSETTHCIKMNQRTKKQFRWLCWFLYGKIRI